jgi:hypothetical protein
MDRDLLHEQLAERLPAVFFEASEDGRPLVEVEAHASAGCSRCARALVNAREIAVTLAESTVPTRSWGLAEPKAPESSLRRRILVGARSALASRGKRAPRRFFDASGEVARLHLGAPGDAERIREIDALAVTTPLADDLCGRLLGQLQGVVGFPLLFVSVVRGERAGYRAQRGLEGFQEASMPRDRRRETTFCTHTVSEGAPLIVPDAASEPFFAGSNMVTRNGIRAYAGVPLRTTRGVVVGTVCVMDFVPRHLGPEVVAALQLFAEPIAAEIERPRLPVERHWPRTGAGAPVHPVPWFQALLQLAAVRAAPTVLLVVSPEEAEALADRAGPGEPVGRLASGKTALLLAAASGAPGWAGGMGVSPIETGWAGGMGVSPIETGWAGGMGVSPIETGWAGGMGVSPIETDSARRAELCRGLSVEVVSPASIAV